MKNKVINLFGNNKIVPNSGVKYSTLLEQFMNPFMDNFKDYKYVEDIFEFAINAWNTANLNNLIPSEEIEKAMNSIEQNKEQLLLLKKMVAHKEEKFKTYTNFIVDFELKKIDAGDPILSVITQEQEAYLANMFEQMDEETNVHSEDDLEENYINRSAIIIKPLQPFLNWFNSLYPDSKMDEIDIDIYLVDDNIDDLEKWLKKKFDKLFTMVLNDWHTNKKEWPQRRNYKMFNLWFRVEISEMIYDLEKRPVLKSE